MPNRSTMKYVYDGVELNATLCLSECSSEVGSRGITVHRSSRNREWTFVGVEALSFHVAEAPRLKTEHAVENPRSRLEKLDSFHQSTQCRRNSPQHRPTDPSQSLDTRDAFRPITSADPFGIIHTQLELFQLCLCRHRASCLNW